MNFYLKSSFSFLIDRNYILKSAILIFLLVKNMHKKQLEIILFEEFHLLQDNAHLPLKSGMIIPIVWKTRHSHHLLDNKKNRCVVNSWQKTYKNCFLAQFACFWFDIISFNGKRTVHSKRRCYMNTYLSKL